MNQRVHIVTKAIPPRPERIVAVVRAKVEVFGGHQDLVWRADEEIDHEDCEFLSRRLENHGKHILDPVTFSVDHAAYEVKVSFRQLGYVSS